MASRCPSEVAALDGPSVVELCHVGFEVKYLTVSRAAGLSRSVLPQPFQLLIWFG